MDAALQAKILQDLVVAQKEARDRQRKLDIAEEVGKLKSEGAKRNVAFGLGLLHKIEDVSNIFRTEDDEELATKDNVAEVNLSIKELTKQLAELKTTVMHEVDMQTIAATSPLGWKVVKQLEVGTRQYATCSSEDVRKAEKEKMSYDRDLKNARASSARGRGHGKVGSSLFDGAKRYQERDDERASKRGRGGGRGGGSSAAAGCFRCGDVSHRVANCRKPFAK